MTREKVGITLTEETLKRLDEISKELGLTKSQAISILINQEYLNNFREENQVFKQ